MERIERKATIGSADSTSLPGGGLPTAIDSLTHLESYYQSRYEHYLAMATEAKENRERVGLLLQDLCRDVLTIENNFVDNGSINRQQNNGSKERRGLNEEKAPYHLPSTESPSSKIRDSTSEWNMVGKPDRFLASIAAKGERDPAFSRRGFLSRSEVEESSAAAETERGIPGSDVKSDHSPSQMKKFLWDLSIAMSVIKSVSNLDSGKTLHQNYLHHLLNTELEQELSVELVELYLEEATRRGYLEPDEFNNNCYIAEPKSEATTPYPHENIAKEKATTEILSGGKSNKPYDLPPSDKLKPTLLKTIEGYIESNRSKRFSIDDVINYLYPQPIRADWNKVQRNKVRTSISNVLGRKAYLGKQWTRIKPGVYRPRKVVTEAPSFQEDGDAPNLSSKA